VLEARLSAHWSRLMKAVSEGQVTMILPLWHIHGEQVALTQQLDPTATVFSSGFYADVLLGRALLDQRTDSAEVLLPLWQPDEGDQAIEGALRIPGGGWLARLVALRASVKKPGVLFFKAIEHADAPTLDLLLKATASLLTPHADHLRAAVANRGDPAIVAAVLRAMALPLDEDDASSSITPALAAGRFDLVEEIWPYLDLTYPWALRYAGDVLVEAAMRGERDWVTRMQAMPGVLEEGFGRKALLSSVRGERPDLTHVAQLAQDLGPITARKAMAKLLDREDWPRLDVLSTALPPAWCRFLLDLPGLGEHLPQTQARWRETQLAAQPAAATPDRRRHRP